MATTKNLSWKKKCKRLLKILNRLEDAEPFKEPVDPLKFKDYPRFITTPMDLQTVGEELKADNYATPTEFANDVRLIFKNSKKYNTNKESRIYEMTVRLSRFFEDKFRNIFLSHKHRKSATESKYQ